MTIHKAGYSVIAVFLLILGTINTLLYAFEVHKAIFIPVLIASTLILLFVLRFFRFPNRNVVLSDNNIISPADGTIVAIEEVEENEFIKDPRIQISIFMSVWSVHINWFPILGKVIKTQHFSGRFMAAWLPKSSTENERALTLIKPEKTGEIVVRQIAGAVARRIITYAQPEQKIERKAHLGFIRFGSRVDVLMPKDFKPTVVLNQKVKGGLTEIAVLQ